MIEQLAENGRRHDAGEVEAGRDEAEYAAIGAGRRHRTHDHVARGHGQPGAKTRGRHHQHQRERRKIDEADQGAGGRRRQQPAGGDQAVAGGAGRENAADQDADRTHGQLAGQRRVGDGERRVVQRAEPHHQIIVEPAAAERQQDEEHHVGEDRGREQQPPAVKRCAGLVAARLGGRLYRLRRLALPDQDQRGKKPDRRGREVGAAPADDAVQEQQRWRGRRIAHHAGEGVEGKHAAGALGRHVLRKQRVVGRMVDRVGEAEHAKHGDEHPERVDQPRHRDGACANDKPADQPQPRARAVDQKTHGRLQHGRGDIEGGERKP